MNATRETAEFLHILERAEAATRAEQWQEAADLRQEIVERNPVQGEFWTSLADAALKAGDVELSIKAAEQALELGDDFPAHSAYRIACGYSAMNDREQALVWLGKALDLGFRHLDYAWNDPMLEPLRDDPRFHTIIYASEESGQRSRDEGWQRDLDLLAREVKRLAHHLPPWGSRDEIPPAIDRLRECLSDLTDVQIAVELMKILRLLGDGHARVTGTEQHPELLLHLPVQFYLFEEGLYIIATTQRYEALLGAKVLSFADQPATSVFEALDPLEGRDNEYWPKQVIPYLMRQSPVLHALGLTPESDHVALTVLDRNGHEYTITIAAEVAGSASVVRRAFPPYPEDWRHFPDTLPEPVPNYLRNIASAYWFDFIEESRTVYFQFNRVANEGSETLSEFADRLFQFIEDHDVTTLVVDVRWNSGGNTFLEIPLLRHLIGNRKINQRGNLFVIIGRRTFSAAQNFTTLVERFTDAIFIGEPTGSSPNFVGETIPFVLPHTGLQINISDLYWVTSWPMDYRTWIAPTIYVPPTFAAFATNRDVAMEAIEAYRDAS